MKKIRRKYLEWAIRLPLANKIAIVCLILFLGAISISTISNSRVYESISVNQAADTLEQTLYLVDNNVDTTIELVVNSAKAIISFDKAIEQMSEEKMVYYSENAEYIRNILSNAPYSSSVHLFNNYQEVMNVGIGMVNYPKSDDIKDANWYYKVEEGNGDFLFYNQGGDFFVEQNNYDYMTMACEFNNIETQENLGVLCINFTRDVISSSYENLVNEYNIEIVITDENDDIIVGNLDNIDFTKLKNAILDAEGKYVMSDIGGTRYMIASIQNEKDWHVYGFMDVGDAMQEVGQFSFVSLLLIIINGLLMFLGIILFMQREVRPLSMLGEKMQSAASGKLEMANFNASNKDFYTLKEGYNSMVDEINELIVAIKRKEEMKASLQFDALQAQIKPHFLYNTFDTMASLALMGDNKMVYETLKALGSFYRISLSKGSDIITLEEEINLVKNYTMILGVRYDDAFSVEYDVADEMMSVSVPKLILQPLVENAIYHGIRPSGEHGTVYIRGRLENGNAVISVEDDGLGMSDEMLEAVLNDTGDKKSFGLKATIEKLNIMYKGKDSVEIESKEGAGTKIIISIPVESLRKGE